MTSDDDRIAYLAGDTGRPIDPGDREDLDGLRASLADPAIWVEPDPVLEDRVLAAVAAASGARPSPAPPARSRRFRPRLVYATVAAAAAIVIAVAVGVVLHGTGKPATQFTAALTATGLVPGASGDATLTQTKAGWRIELQTTGLPRLDHGRYYEAWLKNAAGILVPVGTFNQGPDVTLWAGVSPVNFPVLTITEQLVGHGQASSGKRVLAGPVDIDP
jgi:Anti-sigma-K factor rskA